MAQNPVVTFEMEDGSIIKAELYPEVAPNTVNNFISLVKKGYAVRERSEQDRRVVFIHLTLKGRKAFHHHAEFHRRMTDAVLDVLDENEVLVLAKALNRLTLFFRQYKA